MGCEVCVLRWGQDNMGLISIRKVLHVSLGLPLATYYFLSTYLVIAESRKRTRRMNLVGSSLQVGGAVSKLIGSKFK